jgi:TonB-dependent receptor
MHKPTFHQTPLARGIAFALGLSALTPGFAQTAEEQPAELEEIVVTGIRASLTASMDLKRNSFGVVDAITAEDMGVFPDTNLAESLQRITGVSIDRERGEGARVTVRGFGPDFNLVTLNGRQMPTAGGPNGTGLGRSFDFGNLASEGITSVEVFKSGRADVPTGGIGATININTTRPLDSPGFRATASASGMYDDSRTKLSDTNITPELSGLISDTFMDDRIGVSLSLIRQERESGSATANVGGWRTFSGETDNCWCGQGPSEWGGIPPAGHWLRAGRLRPHPYQRPADLAVQAGGKRHRDPRLHLFRAGAGPHLQQPVRLVQFRRAGNPVDRWSERLAAHLHRELAQL